MPDRSKLQQFAAITGKSDKSFAAYTIRNRLPHILGKIIQENQYSGRIKSSLEELGNNLLHGKIKYLPKSGDEVAEWKNWLQPAIGKSWFEVPFYFAEAYFYQMILDMSGYFNEGKDSFATTKHKDINENDEQFATILKNMQLFLQDQNNGKYAKLRFVLHLCLWGNKSDLSQLPLSRTESQEDRQKYTLIDDSYRIGKQLLSGCRRLDIVLDNAGMELYTDLLLADALISEGTVQTVILHSKKYPTFVSDATSEDIRELSDFLGLHRDRAVRDLQVRIEEYLRSGSLEIKEHSFWNAPLHFYEMPKSLHHELKQSDMVIFKGDANYRRIFGDRVLPLNFEVAGISNYLPASCIAIRILKSEIMTGLSSSEISKTSNFEPGWLVNGRYGMIQQIKI